ncbi:MAG: hypothetical protein ACQ9MH_04690 [Nitrospinales bacterium]
MKSYLTGFFIIIAFIISGCAGGPKVEQGKAAIYGTVKTDSHKDLIAKAAKRRDVEYSIGGNVVYTKDMVNYDEIKEIYVCLLDPNFSGGNEHSLVANKSGFSLRSIAAAPGDILRVKNNTSHILNFFIADLEDGIQMFEPIEPGNEGSIIITLQGDIELSSEEDERLIVSILSRPGLISRKVSSGDSYSFEHLEPNTYGIIFWFWRLGYIEKKYVVEAGKNSRVNETLSVDRVIKNKDEL